MGGRRVPPRRQDGHGLARCSAAAAVQIVADRALVDEEIDWVWLV